MNKLTMQNLDHLAGPGDKNATVNEAFSGVESERGTRGNVPARSTENNPDGSVWRDYAQLNGKSTNGRAGTEYTGWDSRGNAFQRVRAPSTVMSDEYGFGSGRAPRSSGFAKVKVVSSPALPMFLHLTKMPERSTHLRQGFPRTQPPASQYLLPRRCGPPGSL